jgi:hypothetical protein
MNKSILIGTHGVSTKETYPLFARMAGYIPTSVDTPEAMLAEARKGVHNAYVMDGNLGSRRALIVEPALAVWDIVKYRVGEGERANKGDTLFMAISGTNWVVDELTKLAIPARINDGFSLLDFLTRKA